MGEVMSAMAKTSTDQVRLAAGKAAKAEQDNAPPSRIAFFGYDAFESTIIKRANAFLGTGASVSGFMFKRVRPTSSRQVACKVFSLGNTEDRNYLRRIPKLIFSLPKLWRERRLLASCNVFYARNIDMLLLAVLARGLSRSKSAVVYEVLDVHRGFLRRDVVGHVFRWAERRLMRRASLLVISSPEFATEYFEPYQKYSGPVFLLENKIGDFHAALLTSPGPPARLATMPWVIGWFGSLRCRRSLALLSALARRLGPRIEIHLRGVLAHEDLTEEEIAQACAQCPNIRFLGAYASPIDLPNIYGRVHFSWCFDFLDAGANSDWLLPNRVYEGGAYGAVCLARRGTASGRFVEQRGLGITFAESFQDGITSFLEGLTPEKYVDYQNRLRKLDRATFYDVEDTSRLVRTMKLLASHG